MSDRNQSQIVPSEYGGRNELLNVPQEPFDSSESGEGQNLFSLVNDRLAGRWKFAIPLAFVLMMAGAVGGYFATDTYYESNAMIHVAPKKTPLLHETIETGMIPNYAAYVNSQAALLTSSRVVERAMNSLDPNQLPYEDRNDAMRSISRNLSARSGRQSELITVSFRADTPRVAQEVLNAVLNAYTDLYASVDGDDFNRRVAQLRQLRETLRTQVRQKRSEIAAVISDGEFVVSDFNRLIEERALQIQALESELRRHASRLAMQAEPSATTTDQSTPVTVSESDLVGMAAADVLAQFAIEERDLEAFDAEFAQIARNRRVVMVDLELAASRYDPSHLHYKTLLRNLESVDRLYDARVIMIVPQYLRNKVITEQGPVFAEGQVEFLQSELERLRQEAREMGNAQLSLTQMRNELRELEDEYSNVNTRIRQLEVESDSIRTGNISVAAPADRPTSPSGDRRRTLALLGAAGGFGIGFGLFFLLGSIDRRAFAVQQIRAGGEEHHLLGVLPYLAPSGDFEHAKVAAHCVHQIRNQIEARRRSSRSTVLTISSPYQGDGKTSLTLALGASYAAAGFETVIVDGDLVGQCLTDHLMLRGHPGLQEAIVSGQVNGQVQQLGMERLSVLPSGSDPSIGSERIRTVDLARLFEQMRKRFEIILVDTGPLCGSIESIPIATASDGVVLTVRRGRRRSGLDECLAAFQQMRVPYLGMVLNHAMRRDCERYVSKSKMTASDFIDQPGHDTVARTPAKGTSNALHDAVLKSSWREAATGDDG